MNFFASGFAWILTESIFASYGHSLRNLPYGLLAIEGYEVNHYDVIIQEMISSVEQVMTSIGDDDMSPYDISSDFLMRYVFTCIKRTHHIDIFMSHFFMNLTDLSDFGKIIISNVVDLIRNKLKI